MEEFTSFLTILSVRSGIAPLAALCVIRSIRPPGVLDLLGKRGYNLICTSKLSARSRMLKQSP